MTAPALLDTAGELLGGDRGILAMDESIATCDRRFAAAGIDQEVDGRRAYRELLVSTPGLAESIHGAILYDETIRQRQHDGTPMIDALTDAAIIPGIKVDAGTVPLAGHPGERITEGLDGLRGRLAEYAGMGARFAKWRACSLSARAGRVVGVSRPMPVRWRARRALSGGRAGPDRGARGADGRRAHGAL